jgi:hypothetical protein
MQADNRPVRRRVPLASIEFTVTRNGVNGFAKDWYFWVSHSFKPALDVEYSEYIDENKTAVRRNRRSHELFGVSHDELKRQIKASGQLLADSKAHRQVMACAVRYLVETEGEPPLYCFREMDSLESQSGEWYLRVEHAVSDTAEKAGSVNFQLYARNDDLESCNGVWRAIESLTTSQQEFVNLLRSGRCKDLNLADATVPLHTPHLAVRPISRGERVPDSSIEDVRCAGSGLQAELDL